MLYWLVMRERIGHPGRWLLRLFLFPLRLPLLILIKIWRLVGLIGLWLRHKLLWGAWLRLGKMGLALRKLNNWFLWQPILFLTLPYRWVYGKTLARPVQWLIFRLGLGLGLVGSYGWYWLARRVRGLARLMGRLVVRPGQALLTFTINWLIARWQAGDYGRWRWRRRWASWWLVRRSRLRLLFGRPKPIKNSLIIPRATFAPSLRPYQRTTRLATALASLSLLTLLALITARQFPGLDSAAAQNPYTINPKRFPTFIAQTETAPTATPIASPTPIPPTPWPTPDPLNGGGSVAFTLHHNGNSDIFALSIGQSQPIRLTNHPADDRDPAWSPSGRELAFASRRDGNWEIYVLDLQSGDLRRLTNDLAFDGGPAWSPDGKWLVFESYRENNLDLYLLKADGSQMPIRLTENPAPDFAPAWSPAGRQIAFTSWRSGNKDIFLLSLDAVSDSTAFNLSNSSTIFEDDPAFSPDGQTLAYYDGSSGFELVYTLPLREGSPAGTPTIHGQGHHPTWSPDGQALAYINQTEGQNHLIASTLDAWSVAPQAFTANGRLDSPTWSALTLPRTLPNHIQAMNQQADQPLFIENLAPDPAGGPPYQLFQLPINAPAPYLSDRVDQSFLALRDQVILQSGWDFLGEVDNMYAPLASLPLPGLSAQSWNKAGRAFDFYARHALAFEPQLEIVRQEIGHQTYWRTYLRATVQDGSMGEPLRDLPWDFRARFGAEPQYYDQGGKWRDSIPAGYYLDFTALAADYGWTWIPAADNWRTFYPAIFFWHYENQQNLTWEQAMLELFRPDELLPNP